ncbi:hypothetical protein D3C81_885040 [compost metagenome]
MLQGGRVCTVDFHWGECAGGATLAKPGLQASGKATEMWILPVTEREQGVVQIAQGPRLAEHFAFEAAGTVWRLAIAEGTDHEQRAFSLVEIVFGQFGQWTHLYWQAGSLQLSGTLPG